MSSHLAECRPMPHVAARLIIIIIDTCVPSGVPAMVTAEIVAELMCELK